MSDRYPTLVEVGALRTDRPPGPGGVGRGRAFSVCDIHV